MSTTNRRLPLGLQVDPRSEGVIDLLAKLEVYDFSGIVRDCQRKLGWGAAYAEAMSLQCKQFLALSVLDPGCFHAPGRDADEFWHRAVLNTRWYGTMCHEVFGGFLHHSPLAELGEGQRQHRERTPQVLAYWFGAATYGPDYQLLATCQQCRGGAILPVRPAEDTLYATAA